MWQGELYLEFHRGTYTSQCKNKRYNRQSEILYLSTEFVSSMTKSLLGTKYPKDELRYGWEMILTNQFHDIIPGSSIREVYEQCDLDYAEIFSIGQDAYRHARKTLSKVRRKIGFTELKF